MTNVFDQAADLVARLDKDRYFSVLFAPAQSRPHLYALLAYNLEIARVRDVVSDPFPGEVRLQWWRDVLEGARPGDAMSHPLAIAVLDTIERFALPADALVRMIDARIFDLYDDPMPSLDYLEGYAGETASALIQLSAIILCGGSDPGTGAAAGHAGVAYAITGLLRALPFHAARGQCYIPQDVLAQHGLTHSDVMQGQSSPALLAALAQMRGHAQRHLDALRALMPKVPIKAAPAFLSVSLVQPYLDRMAGPGYDPFRTIVDLPQWRKQIRLWSSARRARALARTRRD